MRLAASIRAAKSVTEPQVPQKLASPKVNADLIRFEYCMPIDSFATFTFLLVPQN